MRSVSEYGEYTLREQNYDYVDYYEFQTSRAQLECQLAREEWTSRHQPGTACPPHWDRSAVQSTTGGGGCLSTTCCSDEPALLDLYFWTRFPGPVLVDGY